MIPADHLIAKVVGAIRNARVDLSSEKQTQADLGRVLDAAGLVFEREVRFSPSDVIDFFGIGVGIEVKLKGARKMDVFRQLERYARHDRVEALILASNLSMGLPQEIEGKPAYFVRLGEAWL